MGKRRRSSYVPWQDWMYVYPVVRYEYPTYTGHAMPDQQSPRVWNISGQWQTNFGPMSLTLQQDGVTVTGTYQAGTSHGEIVGAMRGTTMIGYWRRLHPPGTTENAGRIEFRFHSNGYGFDGNWSYGQNLPEAEKKWTGTKIQ